MMKNNYNFVFVPQRLNIKLCFTCSIQLILKKKQLQVHTSFYQCKQGRVDFHDQLPFQLRCADTQFASVNVILKTRMGQKIAGVVNIVLAGKTDQFSTVKLERCPDTNATLQFALKRQKCGQQLMQLQEGESQPVLHYIPKRFEISEVRSSRLDKSSVSRVSSLSKSTVRQQLKTTNINTVNIVQRKQTDETSLIQALKRDIQMLKSDIQVKRKKYLDEHRDHLAQITIIDQQLQKAKLQLQQYRVCLASSASVLKSYFQFSDQSAPEKKFWETLQAALQKASFKQNSHIIKINELQSQVTRLSQINQSLQSNRKSNKNDQLLIELKACLASHQDTIFQLQSQRLSAQEQASNQKREQRQTISRLEQQLKQLKQDIINKQKQWIKQNNLNYQVLRQQFDHVSLQNQRLRSHQESLLLELNALKALNKNMAHPVILQEHQTSILSPTKLTSLYKLCQQKDAQITELQNFNFNMQKQHKLELEEMQGRLKKCQKCSELAEELGKKREQLEESRRVTASQRRMLQSKEQELQECLSSKLMSLQDQKRKLNMLRYQYQLKCKEDQQKEQEMQTLRTLRKQLEDQLRLYEQTQYQLRARLFQLQFKLHSVYIAKCQICTVGL